MCKVVITGRISAMEIMSVLGVSEQTKTQGQLHSLLYAPLHKPRREQYKQYSGIIIISSWVLHLSRKLASESTPHHRSSLGEESRFTSG